MALHQALKSHTLTVVLVVFSLSLTWPLGRHASAQTPQLIVASARWVGRAAALIGEFLAQYAAGKVVDNLIGDGAGLRDTLAEQRDQLRAEAKTNAANRQILLRQAAILDGLRSDLNLLLTRRPPATESAEIRSRTTGAIEELKSVQADHDRRIGRLEEGQESLRRLLESLAATPSSENHPSKLSSAIALNDDTCKEANTGHYGFTNSKTVTRFTVVVYYRRGNDSNRTIIVPPGQTQYVYEFPAGAHNYVVTYRAQVPIMTFPRGAPTMEKDVVYLRGEIYVERCKSGVLEIK